MRVLPFNLGVRVRGTGRAQPGLPVENAALLALHPQTRSMPPEAQSRLAERWARMTGIRSRHLARMPDAPPRPDEATSESLAIQACQTALGPNSGRDIEALVHGTTTSRRYTGAQGPVILSKLKSHAPSFEIKAGCSSSLVSLQTAASLLLSGYSNVMVTCAETLSKVIDPDQRQTWFILADGGAALWLERVERAPEFEIQRVLYHTDGRLADVYTTQGYLPPNQKDLESGGYVMRGDGARLEAAAKEAYMAMLNAMLPRPEDRKRIRWLIPHQINRRIIQNVTDAAGLTAEWLWNAESVGNLGGTSILFSLTEALDQRRFAPGDEILMMSVGGGLSYAMQLWRKTA